MNMLNFIIPNEKVSGSQDEAGCRIGVCNYNSSLDKVYVKCGPPPEWIGTPPPKENVVFIDKIPKEVFPEELVNLCEQFGKLYDFKFIMKFGTENRGLAFVSYLNFDDASKAVKCLNKYEIKSGCQIRVSKLINNCRLFVGGLPKEKGEEEITREIAACTKKIPKITFFHDENLEYKNRGFVFLEYENYESAVKARRELIKKKLFNLPVTVTFASVENEVEEEIITQVKTLFIRNLCRKVTEDQLFLIFSMGGCLKVRHVKKSKDFAFIHYFEKEDAEVALERFNGMILEGRMIEVTWAIPSQPLKQKLLKEKSASNHSSDIIFCEPHSRDKDMSNPNVHQDWFLPKTGLRNSSIYIDNISVTARRPIQCLQYLSLENNWGTPIFEVSRVNQLYQCKVKIPAFLHNGWFFRNEVFLSENEAKHFGASYVLKELGVIDVDYPFQPVTPSDQLCCAIEPTDILLQIIHMFASMNMDLDLPVM